MKIYNVSRVSVCVCVCGCVYKQDLKLDKQQWLIYNQTKPNLELLINYKYANEYLSTIYIYRNLLSFLIRCGTRPYERGTQWVSNSLV